MGNVNMEEHRPSLFDAIRIVSFPGGHHEAPVYYSQTGRSSLRIGDIGVVIDRWPGNKLRVEAVAPSGAIDWQDHLTPDQVEVIPVTAGPYCRRRVNEAWAWNLAMNGETIKSQERQDALSFARKVMAFARRNVDILADRLTREGYCFANAHPFVPPPRDVPEQLKLLSEAGVQFPIAIEAWLLEVGTVDFCGTHPNWKCSAYAGMHQDDSEYSEPWYTDPLVIDIDLQSIVSRARKNPENIDAIDFAPDNVTKANVSGSGPISIRCASPTFDDVLIGQHGSFTLLSYLSHAFEWAGFPGFRFIADAPIAHIQSLAEGLVRL